jgi:glycine oxidase
MPDCDVAVVGAGVIGEAVAYELVARGASVTLIDSRGSGLGSTQASAGMLVPYLEGLGQPLLPIALKSLAMYDKFIERISRDAGMGIGYRRTGSLQVLTEDEADDPLRASAAALRKLDVECEWLDRAAVRKTEPQLSPDVSGGLLVRSHGSVVASDLSGALVAAAIKHGARIRIPARARRISDRGDHLEIHLDHDVPLTARNVVVAAGSWSGQIEIDGIQPLPVRPIRGQLLQLAGEGRPLDRIVWGTRCYLVPMAGGVLVGATVEDAGFDERATVAGVRDLLEAACDLIPHLGQATFVGARVGLRPATADEMPIIGRSRKMPRLLYATGHYRNGVLLAPLTAHAIADLVVDSREDPLLSAATPQRFGEY